MSTVEFITKLHDAACMIKDACEEYLEKNAPSQQQTWNPDKIAWTDKQGEKGPFQIAEDPNNLDFKSMLKDLATHQGKLQRNRYFYWTFQNGATVGRKKK
jgi:hypothetical protein